MCGRYLIEEEAYSDILEILYRTGAAGPGAGGDAVAGGGSGGAPAGGSAAKSSLPPALKEAMAVTMLGKIPETVSGDVRDLFPDVPAVVTSGEVFPTNIAPILINGGDGVMAARWGFPHWKNNSVIINARAETAPEKRIFRESLLERRCVIPSSGFFEWGAGRLDNLQIGMLGSGTHENIDFTRNRRVRKVKHLLRLPDTNKLYMAGFWNASNFVILTTAACGSVAPLHDRMPLILSPDECDDWLGSVEFMEYALRRPGPKLVLSAA